VAQEVARYDAGSLPVSVAANIAASFQQAVTEVLADRAANAMMMFAAEHGRTTLVASGGVAANASLHAALHDAAAAEGFAFAVPPARLCTDNAVMVAWAAIERLRLGWSDSLGAAPRPRGPLDSNDSRR
jgi:N6-L-threonylcarbamoyladenine synthase